MEVLTGTDFFTVEVLTLKGLMTYDVLFFIQLETRRDSARDTAGLPGGDNAISRPAMDGATSP
jgi:hypothetical protein